MTQPRVYSYLRFSDPKQSAGSSADRQIEYAHRWAAERGMSLDESLSMRDEGLSAYHQRHVSRGALGVFLVAIDEGRIPQGSVLIVEGLDRLSRAEPIQAQAQLAQIINAGITVVTASDGKEYNRERIKSQPMDLVYSLLVMIRAHEESDTKSKRVRAAIRRQCSGWLAGTWRGVIRNGKDPAWVRWTGSAFELIPERAEAVRAAIALFRRGDGGTRIVRGLDDAGLSMTERGSEHGNIYKSLRLPALYGVKRLAVDGEQYDLPGYYPPIISEREYQDLQLIMSQRNRRRGRAEIPGIVSGMGITYCGYCGRAMVAQNLMNRTKKPDGTPQDGHRRMMCDSVRHSQGECIGTSCSVVPIERALLTYCSDQINLSALMSADDQTQPIRVRLATTRARIAETEAQIERVTAAMLADDGPAPAAFARKARALEADLSALQAEAEHAERELSRLASADAPTADTWAGLADRAMALDEDARLQVRQLVIDTFERLVIYHRGVMPDESDGRTIDVMMIAKGGGGRLLRIDRRTGEWRAGEDWDAAT